MNQALAVVSTEKAPKALGPYSQAIKANGFIFLSGQIPIQPVTGDLLKGTIAEQTALVLTNLRESSRSWKFLNQGSENDSLLERHE